LLLLSGRRLLVKAGMRVDGERSSARRWILRRQSVSTCPVDPVVSEGMSEVPAAIDGELNWRLATASTNERHRLTQAARPALATLLSAEPELKRVELDHERGATVLSFANGARLRAAVDRSVHPTLERLARKLGGDPIYLSAAWLSAEGGVLLRLVCGAFWPIEIGPLVPAAG
jgi:hypothetical protein